MLLVYKNSAIHCQAAISVSQPQVVTKSLPKKVSRSETYFYITGYHKFVSHGVYLFSVSKVVQEQLRMTDFRAEDLKGRCRSVFIYLTGIPLSY